jgi:glycosyltransferase involved in cell wall biosynthesis
MTPHRHVAVCIPAFGPAGELDVLLTSIAASTPAGSRVTVVVVLDGPDPALRAVAETHGAVIGELPSNQGSYVARNAALDLLPDDAEVVAFTDMGSTVAPGWIAAHLDALTRHDLSGGAVEFVLGSPPTPAELVDAARHLDQRRYVEQLGFAATANLAVRREVAERLRFSEELRSGGDRDFCNRATTAGLSLVYTPGAVVLHPARRSARTLLRKVARIARGTTGQRAIASPMRQAEAHRPPPLREVAARHGVTGSPLWWARARLLQLVCDLLWILLSPGSVGPALLRRLRGLRRAPRTREDRPPRTLIIVENLPVPLDRRVWMEALALRAAGWEVTVVCPLGPGFEARDEVIDGITVHRHPLPTEGRGLVGFAREYGAALWWEWRLTRRVWSRARFDVLHLCNPPDLLFPMALWYRVRHGVRVLYDQHDLVPHMYVAKYGRRDLVHRVLLLCERLTYAVAHHVVTTNESAHDVALSRGGKRPHEVTIVGSGPDLDLFVPSAPDARHRRGRRHLVGYVGVMGDQDGTALLLDAADHVIHELGHDVQFMCIGDGPALPDLREEARRRGLEEHLELPGLIHGPELLERLSSTDVCVDPEPVNGYSEYCTTNKVLEYMALGKPVVQFDRIEGRRSADAAALYAQPNDGRELGRLIAQLLDDPEARERMGRIGRERMERHLGWAVQRTQLLAAYDAALGRSRSRPVATSRSAQRGVRRSSS